MVYNSFLFILLFPLIFLFYYLIPARYPKVRNLYLLVVSYALYISWKPVYALILLGVTGVTYYSAIKIEQSHIQKKRKRILTLGVFLALLPLAFFKYFNFINEVLVDAMSAFGLHIELLGLNWAIPIGISFFTFQALGYVWDVYYGKIDAERDFSIYALFISFFPSILSGPINKASLVIPQIKSLRTYFDYEKAVEGLKLVLWGMFMKVVVADRIGLYVDTVFGHYMGYSSLSCMMACFLYSIQIYADFGGYSLMAIGVGKVLGFELTENFKRPLFAFSVTDFWHRWHISLSTWLKDYIYIPLGGSRCSKTRNYWNIMVTFLISGIWHGANWTFILWGMIHGLFQVVEKALGQNKRQYDGPGKMVKIFITLFLITFAWIIFRMPTISDAFGVIAHIIEWQNQKGFFWPSYNNYFITFGVTILLLKDFRDEFFPKKFPVMENNSLIVRWSTYLMLMTIILLNGVLGSDQFIYSNF